MNRLRVLAGSLLSGVALIGCGSGDGVPREPLAGKVTFDGRPLEKGMISFVSAQDSEATAGGVIEQGSYSIPREDGLAPGSYRVSVWAHQATGRRVKDRENPGATIDEVRQVVPGRYNQQTQLTADVKAEETNSFDFDLTGSTRTAKVTNPARN